MEITPDKSLTSKAAQSHLLLIDKPVRSGQAGRALLREILWYYNTTSAGQTLSAGSIACIWFITGAGTSGVLGDTSARIFCRN